MSAKWKTHTANESNRRALNKAKHSVCCLSLSLSVRCLCAHSTNAKQISIQQAMKLEKKPSRLQLTMRITIPLIFLCATCCRWDFFVCLFHSACTEIQFGMECWQHNNIPTFYGVSFTRVGFFAAFSLHTGSSDSANFSVDGWTVKSKDRPVCFWKRKLSGRCK